MNSNYPYAKQLHPHALLEALEPRQLLSAVKIMPLGDSVTESFTDAAGYRFWLFKQLKLAGYDVDFVGSVNKAFNLATQQSNSGPTLYTDYDQDHEGHSGFRSDQLEAGMPTYLAKNVPDVVLLDTGLNDMLQSRTVAETIGHIDKIVKALRAANPHVTVLVAQLTPTLTLNENVQALNAAIPGYASAANTSQSRVIAVDLNSGFNAATSLRDEFHPNLLGENKIAQTWFAALQQVLPAPNPAPPPVTWLSDLPATSMTNGLGPVELNFSNGDAQRFDGGAIDLNGVTTIKGLGVAANSEIVYNLSGKYTRFQSDIGIDDEVGTAGTVVFQVYVDNVKKFDSGIVTGASATKAVSLDVTGATTLKLVVLDGGDTTDFDHGDWANARLVTTSTPTPPSPNPTPAPVPPSITRAQFDFNHSPHALIFTFSADVSSSISPDDLRLENLTSARTVPTGAIAVSFNKSTNTATFRFPGFKKGILPDGHYRATLLAAGIRDAAGTSLASDVAFDLFFMVGDANHDGIVNRSDFSILKANFGRKGRDFAHGDFNYDGKVDKADFKMLASRYGISVLAPSSRPSAGAMRKLMKQFDQQLSAQAKANAQALKRQREEDKKRHHQDDDEHEGDHDDEHDGQDRD